MVQGPRVLPSCHSAISRSLEYFHLVDRKREGEVEKCLRTFSTPTPALQVALSPLLHWPEFSHMGPSNYKKGWKMCSVYPEGKESTCKHT